MFEPSHKVLQAAGIKNYWRIRKSVHSNMNSHSELHHRSSSGAIHDISHAQLSDSKGPPPALDEKKVRPPPPKCKPLPPPGKAKPHKSPKLIRELPGDDAKLDGALAILKHTRQLRCEYTPTSCIHTLYLSIGCAQRIGRDIAGAALLSVCPLTLRSTWMP